MAIVKLTPALEKLDKVKTGLSDIAFYLASAAGDLDEDPSETNLSAAKGTLEQFAADARALGATLNVAIAAVASLAADEHPLILADHSTLTGYNFSQAGAVHAVAAQVSGLMVSTLKARGYCACNASGTCAAHAGAFNELHAAERHLSQAAGAFINAGK